MLKILATRLFLMLCGVVFLFWLNFIVLDPLFIPDPCFYHSGINKPGWLFRIFYTLNSGGENGHPFPTLFNFLFTLFLGAFLGNKLSTPIVKRISKK